MSQEVCLTGFVIFEPRERRPGAARSVNTAVDPVVASTQRRVRFKCNGSAQRARRRAARGRLGFVRLSAPIVQGGQACSARTVLDGMRLRKVVDDLLSARVEFSAV